MIGVCNVKRNIDVEHIVGYKNIDAYLFCIEIYRLMLPFDIRKYQLTFGYMYN